MKIFGVGHTLERPKSASRPWLQFTYPWVQFMWQGWHSLLTSAYLNMKLLAPWRPSGHFSTQFGPSLKLRHFTQCSGPYRKRRDKNLRKKEIISIINENIKWGLWQTRDRTPICFSFSTLQNKSPAYHVTKIILKWWNKCKNNINTGIWKVCMGFTPRGISEKICKTINHRLFCFSI